MGGVSAEDGIVDVTKDWAALVFPAGIKPDSVEVGEEVAIDSN